MNKLKCIPYFSGNATDILSLNMFVFGKSRFIFDSFKRPGPVLCLWLNKVSAKERKCYLYKVFFHLPKPCSSVDRNGPYIRDHRFTAMLQLPRYVIVLCWKTYRLHFCLGACCYCIITNGIWFRFQSITEPSIAGWVLPKRNALCLCGICPNS